MRVITETILETLTDMALHPYRMIYGYIPKEVSRKSIQVTLRRLEKKGYIQKGLVEDEICIKLTESGYKILNGKRMRRQERRLLDIKPSQKRWDSLWRVVIFDIPEINKKIRQALRESLKMLEFWPLQKSVWVSKNNYTKELKSWVEDLGLSKYILIFETKDIGIKTKETKNAIVKNVSVDKS